MYEAVRISIKKDDGSDDVSGGESYRSVRANRRTHDGRKNVVVVHLKSGIAHDLKPMHNRLDRCEGVKMGVGRDLLIRSDVGAPPIEEPNKGVVYNLGKDGRVNDCLPHSGRRQDGFSTKEEE